MRIAVIGAGIAGNAAAWALSARHRVVVYDKDLRPGGHSHTVELDYDGRRIAVDTGFIVYNELNYPGLTALFAHLRVETRASDMSFSVSADGGRLEWAGRGRRPAETLDGLFAQRRNLVSPAFLWMLREVARFNRESRADLAIGALQGLSLGDYLAQKRFSRRLVRDYLLPMGAAIWSTPADRMLDFPAQNFVAFFSNHRLLHPDAERPVWRTVCGGSRTYVEKLCAPFRDQMRLGTRAVAIERGRDGVTVTDGSGGRDRFDQVVIAAHSDQALAMLADAHATERAVLAAIRYRPNTVYLHRDPALMPRRKAAWAAWNFLCGHGRGADGGDIAVTYWMNALQGIDPACPLFVSLNPPAAPRADLTFARFVCEHPQFDTAAFAAQSRLEAIQGVRRTWFCGAWTGYGFHEDGLRSGLAVAHALGAAIPWWRRPAVYAEAAE
ncbi:MAG: FAD-dependent oxidoreductase [Pseudorhodoplanes sp.]|nr:MAG: FAD-dependent oxidoreductase [Pseudorhodoplanes sp.]